VACDIFVKGQSFTCCWPSGRNGDKGMFRVQALH